MLEAEAQRWGYPIEGRALHDVERELREIKSMLAALMKHLGVDAGSRGH